MEFMAKAITKAVFPVAGLGTRFLPASKVLPKEMLPIIDKPLIQYAIDEALEAGISDIMMVTGRGKNILEDHFDHAPELEKVLRDRNKTEELQAVLNFPKVSALSYTRQQQPLGLGHAIWCARKFVGDEPFAVLLPDDLIQASPGCLKQMIEVYKEVGGNIVATSAVPNKDTEKYGILSIESDDGKLVRANGIIEKPSPDEAPSNLSVIGRYILQPSIFKYLQLEIKGAGGEIQLTDAIKAVMSDVTLHGFRYDGVRFDCGSKKDFICANVAFALARDDLRNDVHDALSKLIKF